MNSKEFLDDTLINAGLKLLKQLNSRIAGLQDVVIGKKQTKDFVQILHSHPIHWVCVTNIGCGLGKVKVLDSSSSPQPDVILQQITALVNIDESQLELLYMDVASQPDSNSCGLYALANATALCAVINPTSIKYNHDKMRSHLRECFLSNNISRFPGTERTATKDIKTVFKIKDGKCIKMIQPSTTNP